MIERRLWAVALLLAAAAWTAGALAGADAVPPVSHEVTCVLCHASSGNPTAMPNAGWVKDSDPLKDSRLNILRKHDDRIQSNALFQTAAAAAGYGNAGLFAANASKPVLCIACHGDATNPGYTGVPALAKAMSARHETWYGPGHAGQECESCHDFGKGDVQSANLPKRVITVEDCSACHSSTPNTVSGGPHGMHPVGPDWVEQHFRSVEGGIGKCEVCHGPEDRGTVLSRTLADRKIAGRNFPAGTAIGCYSCHDGPTPGL